MIELPPIPPNIAKLPRDERGYPVPWFVTWIDGKPEFRIADAPKLLRAVRENLCWVCGEPFHDSIVSFVTGPMCVVNRTSAEPPSHPECAEFSVRACPFLSMPKAKRRDAGLPENTCHGAGVAIMRNPGVSAVYTCNRYRLFPVSNGVLFRLPEYEPGKVLISWWSEGRAATRAEVLASIDSGLPVLRSMAEKEGPEAVAELEKFTQAALVTLPA